MGKSQVVAAAIQAAVELTRLSKERGGANLVHKDFGPVFTEYYATILKVVNANPVQAEDDEQGPPSV